jgi:hypothetical protein
MLAIGAMTAAALVVGGPAFAVDPTCTSSSDCASQATHTLVDGLTSIFGNNVLIVVGLIAFFIAIPVVVRLVKRFAK